MQVGTEERVEHAWDLEPCGAWKLVKANMSGLGKSNYYRLSIFKRNAMVW